MQRNRSDRRQELPAGVKRYLTSSERVFSSSLRVLPRRFQGRRTCKVRECTGLLHRLGSSRYPRTLNVHGSGGSMPASTSGSSGCRQTAPGRCSELLFAGLHGLLCQRVSCGRGRCRASRPGEIGAQAGSKHAQVETAREKTAPPPGGGRGEVRRGYLIRIPGWAPSWGSRIQRSWPPGPAASTMPSDTPNFILRGARFATMTVSLPSSCSGA